MKAIVVTASYVFSGPGQKGQTYSVNLLTGFIQGVQRQVREAVNSRPQTQGLRISSFSYNNLISTAKLLFLLASRRNTENEKCFTSVSLGSNRLLMPAPSHGLHRKPTWSWLL